MPLQETGGAASYDAFGGGAAAINYIEDVFSTYLYTGTGSTQTITNGIDLAGEGGLVWLKSRSSAFSNALFDTVRGTTKTLFSDGVDANLTYVNSLTAFGATGFTLGSETLTNQSGATFASWTFRKQAKFFDVVTYTGTGANRTVSHNLGSVPGCIIVKRTDTTASWQVYHRSLANTEYLVLNTPAAKATGATRWNSTTPTSTEFSLGTDTTVNASGGTYVAYIYAHDAGGFGLSGTDNVISCGSFTVDGTGAATVSLGYETQWLLVKSTASTGADGGWWLFDTMRGCPVTTADAPPSLQANTFGAEANWPWGITYPTSTGFYFQEDYANQQFIYIAIRRGPMKVPTSGTQVFTPLVNQPVSGIFQSGILTDQAWVNTKSSSSVGRTWIYDRLRGNNKILTPRENNIQGSGTAAEGTYNASASAFQQQTGFAGNSGFTNTDYNGWFFRRAPGFFDVVCYTGTGSNTTQTHNLGAVPELMILKGRSYAGGWVVYPGPLGNAQKNLSLQNDSAVSTDSGNVIFNNTAPTSSVFTVGTNANVNNSGSTFVAYLFATCAGVSKVGSYTGTGTTKQIDCGFTAGARFVLIKRTDSTGDWYVWDSARGIVAGNDPYLLLNSTAAEVTSTDYVDTYSAGFELSSTAPAAINANGGTFIFLAIA